MTTVFIDGAAGTTGLEIRERLTERRDLDLIMLPEAQRRDPAAREDAMLRADIVILCLPDDAAREAVAMMAGGGRIIDASTAFRTDPAWTYGFPELEPGRPERIVGAERVANPGCYPTGFLALIRPLVRTGLIAADLPLSVNAVSGYSGGGKALIGRFQNPDDPQATDTGLRLYALALSHKHVPEMRVHAGLGRAPIFLPAVAHSYRGMLVEVPLHLDLVRGAPKAIREALADSYADDAIVRVSSEQPDELLIERQAGTDRLELFVFLNEAAGQVRLVAALDNLGKGAAGAAVQNLNLMAGLPEIAGLRL